MEPDRNYNSSSKGMSRRKWLATAGMTPLVTALASNLGNANNPTTMTTTSLPAKELFQIKGTFINAAYSHPMSIKTAEKFRAYSAGRQGGTWAFDSEISVNRTAAKEMFAKLINCSPEELAWVPSTMVGENIVVSGLGLPGSKKRVVTDAYHFYGSLYLYGQLAKQGLDVQTISPRDNRIDMNDLDKAITTTTELVSLSSVSTINGFQHNLKAVCDLAHSRGALVFADIIQEAGAVPIDVRATGVDFSACASYKWLMGDFGAGFLYVRKDRLDRLKRSQYGYRQVASHTSHVFPFDPPGGMPFEWTEENDTAGHFQVGTTANAAIAALRQSLTYLLETDVSKIQHDRQPLVDKLQAELPKHGYIPMTPSGTTSGIVSFAFKDASKLLTQRLSDANVIITLYDNRLRISPSVYNDIADIEKLIEVLSGK
jgi:selenocysteine lyase/cysteine desulfurase